jgi:hypothetical protein
MRKLIINKRYFLLSVALCGGLLLHGCGENNGKNLSSGKGEISRQKEQKEDRLLTLENEEVQLSVAQNGGAYVDFRFKDQDLNPFTWGLSQEEMPENNQGGAVFQGHFLCIGRWGSPSEGEIEAGVPHNGEPANSLWEIRDQNPGSLELQVEAPMDGLSVKRKIKLLDGEAAFQVTEEVKNNLHIGRIYNIVQHATIGPPFLQFSTIINSNAGRGFMQSLSYPDPERFSFSWPEGYADSLKTTVDLRSSAVETNYVATHVFGKEEEYGWITAATPNKGLLLGYIWKVSDYPWLNVWHHMNEGKPLAKGLEFGTTGIGRSYEELLSANTKFQGHNSFEYIDAGERITKSFTAFLLQIPKDFTQVDQISIRDNQLVIEEGHQGQNRLYQLSL